MTEKDVMARTSEQTGAVTDVRGVRKTYEAEGAPVRALRGADLTSARGSSWRSWARRAAASRRC